MAAELKTVITAEDENFKKSMENSKRLISDFSLEMSKLDLELVETGNNAEIMAKKLEQTEQSSAQLEDSIQALERSLAKLKEQEKEYPNSKELVQKIIRTQNAIKKYTLTLTKWKKSEEDLREQLSANNLAITETSTNIEILDAKLKTLNSTNEGMVKTDKVLSNQLDLLNKKYAEEAKIILLTEQKLEDLESQETLNINKIKQTTLELEKQKQSYAKTANEIELVTYQLNNNNLALENNEQAIRLINAQRQTLLTSYTAETKALEDLIKEQKLLIDLQKTQEKVLQENVRQWEALALAEGHTAEKTVEALIEVEKAQTELNKTTNSLNLLNKELQDNNIIMKESNASTKVLASDLKVLDSTYKNIATNEMYLVEQNKILNSLLNEQKYIVEGTKENLDNLTISDKANADAIAKATVEYNNAVIEMNRLNDAIVTNSEAMAYSKYSIESNLKTIELLNSEIKILNTEYNNSVQTKDILIKQEALYNEKLELTNKNISLTEQKLEQLNNAENKNIDEIHTTTLLLNELQQEYYNTSKQIELINKSLDENVAVIKQSEKTIEMLDLQLSKLASSYDGSIKAENDLIKETALLNAKQIEQSKIVDANQNLWQELADTMGDTADATQKAYVELEKSIIAVNKTNLAIEKNNKALEEHNIIIKKSMSLIDIYNSEMAVLNSTYLKTGKSEEYFIEQGLILNKMLLAQTQILEANEKNLEQLSKANVVNTEAINKANIEYNKSVAELNRLTFALSENAQNLSIENKMLLDSQYAVDLLNAKLTTLDATYSDNNRTLDIRTQRYELLNAKMIEEAELIRLTQVKIDMLTKSEIAEQEALNKLNLEMEVFKKNLTQTSVAIENEIRAMNSFSNSISGVTTKFLSVQNAMRLGMDTLRLAKREMMASSAYVTYWGASFEAQMSMVAATLGLTAEQANMTNEEFALLTETAEELGATTEFTAKQVADAETLFVQKGYDAQQTVELLIPTMELATAAELELARAAEVVSGAINIFDLEMQDAQMVVDEFAKTASVASLTGEDLAMSMLSVGAQAKTLSGGITELYTALAILSANEIKGAEAGTKLRNVIISLQNPTQKAAKDLEELGVSAYDANGNFKPLNDTLYELNMALSTLSQEEYNTIMNDIFNARDLAAATTLLNAAGDEWTALNATIEDSIGYADQMATVINDNLIGAFKQFTSALQGVAISIYKDFQEPMSEALKSVTNDLNNFNETLNSVEVSEKISNFAEVMVNAGEIILSVLADIAKSVVNIVNFVSQYGGVMAILIAGLTASLVAYEVQTTSAMRATAGLSREIFILSDATKLLNNTLGGLKTAFKFFKGPVGIAIGTITASAAALKVHSNVVKEAEQALYSFSDTIIGVTNSLSDATATAEQFTANIQEWNELNAIISDTSTTTSELNAAQRELQSLNEWFIANSDGRITQYTIENGLMEEQLSLVEEMYNKNVAIAQQQANMVYDSISIEAYTEDLKNLTYEQQELYKRRDEIITQQVAIQSAIVEYNLIQETTTALTKERAAAEAELVEKIKASGVSMTEEALSVSMLTGMNKNLGKELDEVNEKISENDKAIQKDNATIDIYNQNLEETYNKTTALGIITEKYNKTITTTEANIKLLTDSYYKLSAGQKLNKETTDALILAYPELSDVTNINTMTQAELANMYMHLNNTAIDTAVAEIDAEIKKTEVVIEQTNQRIEAQKSEILSQQMLNAMYSGQGMQYALNEYNTYIGYLETIEQANADINAAQQKQNELLAQKKTIEEATVAGYNANAGYQAELNEAQNAAVINDYQQTANAMNDITQDTANTSVATTQKAVDDQLAIEQEGIQKQQDLLKEQGDAVISVAEKNADANKEVLQQQYDDQIDIIKNATYEEVLIVSDGSNQKTNIYTQEYIMQIKGIDAVTGAYIESINKEIEAELQKQQLIQQQYDAQIAASNQEIQAIYDKMDAEDEAYRKQKEQDQLAYLEEQLLNAETEEQQKAAQKRYDDYVAQLAREEERRNDQARIKELQKEQADIRAKQKEELNASMEIIKEQQELQKQALDDLMQQMADGLEVNIKFIDDSLNALKKDITDIIESGDTSAMEAYLSKFNVVFEEAGTTYAQELQRGLDAYGPLTVQYEYEMIGSSPTGYSSPSTYNTVDFNDTRTMPNTYMEPLDDRMIPSDNIFKNAMDSTFAAADNILNKNINNITKSTYASSNENNNFVTNETNKNIFNLHFNSPNNNLSTKDIVNAIDKSMGILNTKKKQSKGVFFNG